ncbi:MAG: alpha/beta hydrolase fold domain-containing protein [Rhodospirillales bacterium]|nr:alpha/beta hydrolase fold domain-containing protein [Rhodospirillales bacterium]
MSDIDTIDPALVAASRRAAEDEPPVDFRELVDAPVTEIRAAYEATSAYWNAKPPALASVTDTTLDGPHGGLLARVYRPSDTILPGLLYFHGGGFMLGSVDSHDTMCRLLAREAGASVISVDYRLAPEYRFPVAIEECLFACDWLVEHAAEIDVDATRLAVGGDSAGANLALSVLNEKREPLSAGVLFYGCYGHLPEFGYPLGAAAEAYGDGRYGLGLDIMRRFYIDYLSDEADGLDPRFCSLRGDYHGLPPVLLTAAALDPLRDDAEAFRSHLEAAQVPHRYILYPGMPHGFLKFAPEVDAAQQGLRDAATFLTEHWRH